MVVVKAWRLLNLRETKSREAPQSMSILQRLPRKYPYTTSKEVEVEGGEEEVCASVPMYRSWGSGGGDGGVAGVGGEGGIGVGWWR